MMAQDSSHATPKPEYPQRTSRLAIASSVCALIWFIPFAALAGIVLGAIALIRISASQHLLGGRVIAKVSIYVGAFGLCLTLACMMLVPALGRARSGARPSSKNNLKQIGLSVLMYQNDYDEHMPPDLQTLYEAGCLRNPAVFKHPHRGTGKLHVQDIDGTGDYFYAPLRAPPHSRDYQHPPGVPIVWEKNTCRVTEGANVLCRDGHVEWMRLEEFTRRVIEHRDLYREDRPVSGNK